MPTLVFKLNNIPTRLIFLQVILELEVSLLKLWGKGLLCMGKKCHFWLYPNFQYEVSPECTVTSTPCERPSMEEGGINARNMTKLSYVSLAYTRKESEGSVKLFT
ncbi:hypothetical protein CDAR_269571 [Caerostris darwini]|uniref:Uncharacterized protein n=1 Tax=Caerostris darwini TaxID=1538125 RepID=A0AAV4WLK1_9ARAC|nr:hypothetical protein CDAR_269571 [Caerostris darwini]